MNIYTKVHGNPTINNEFHKIFKSGPKWWTDIIVPGVTPLMWLKSKSKFLKI